ncbi:MAG: CtsR family transcriptional regulator [Clostridia bacterium]|nr:CtsR family transcriptional regulator [Clostridia bacterium]
MLADQIAKMIENMLEESGGALELQRNEMAMRLGCVPSQISYVITSRFTPERGYIIESRRGGGGCIRIVRKQMHRDEYLMHFFYAVGEEIDENEARAYLRNLLDQEIITSREATVINSALSGAALQNVTPEGRNTVRAQIFRHILLSLMH